MTFNQQEELFSKFTEEQRAIMFKKGNDYAGADRLSNFKSVGAITQLTPELAALQMIATKVARLGVLLQPGKVANNESIDDSVVDLANYAFLLVCLLREKKMMEEEKVNAANDILSKLRHPAGFTSPKSVPGQCTILHGGSGTVTTHNGPTTTETTTGITNVDLKELEDKGLLTYTAEKSRLHENWMESTERNSKSDDTEECSNIQSDGNGRETCLADPCCKDEPVDGREEPKEERNTAVCTGRR